jgi:hypothetical protein
MTFPFLSASLNFVPSICSNSASASVVEMGGYCVGSTGALATFAFALVVVLVLFAFGCVPPQPDKLEKEMAEMTKRKRVAKDLFIT